VSEIQIMKQALKKSSFFTQTRMIIFLMRFHVTIEIKIIYT